MTSGRKIGRYELIRELRSLGNRVDGAPTEDDMSDVGGFSPPPYRREFGSWANALEHAGYEPGNIGRSISREELIEELSRLNESLGKIPSGEDMVDVGEFSTTPYESEFGSWGEALEAVGLVRSGVTKDDVVECIIRVADEIGHPPTTREYDCHVEHSKTTAIRLFGSWRGALESAGLYEGYEHQTQPVVEKYSAGELIDAILDMAAKKGRQPYGREMSEETPYRKGVFQAFFGSWAEALRTAGLPPRYRGGSSVPGSNHGTYGEGWKEVRREILGRDGWTCQSCGMGYREHRAEFGRGLEVHHIIKIREFDKPEDANFPENLITLCRTCHKEWELVGEMSGVSESHSRSE